MGEREAARGRVSRITTDAKTLLFILHTALERSSDVLGDVVAAVVGGDTTPGARNVVQSDEK